VLQTQLCLLLNSFYEGKYHENIYSYRKGRNPSQAVGLLHEILTLTNKQKICIGLINLKNSVRLSEPFDITKYFKISKKWKSIFQKWVNTWVLGLNRKTKLKVWTTILDRLIWNVVILNGFYKDNVILKPKQLIKKKFSAFQNIITYAEVAVIITTNHTLLELLISKIKKIIE